MTFAHKRATDLSRRIQSGASNGRLSLVDSTAPCASPLHCRAPAARTAPPTMPLFNYVGGGQRVDLHGYQGYNSR